MCGMIVIRVPSVPDESGACSSQIQFLEEIVALVVDHDEGRKFSTSIFQIASMPSSGYSTVSTF